VGTAVTDPLVGRLVDGRYEVVSRIARGGMATVYLAVDRRLDRDVALKVMHPHLAEGTSGADFVARFRREARAAARLTHPGLVGVFDQGVDGETSYLTMEYVDGSNLRRRLGEQGALTVADALRITEAVLDALGAAHRAGLVHRDIKPENVLLSSEDRVKLADFGLARAVTEVTATTTGTVLGTVAYLAPELVVRGSSDARTDVYACGILLFEMLTGRQPYTGETPIQVAFQHVNSDIPAPSDVVSWLPVELDDLVRALAAREPDDRPVDAGAAVTLLRRVRSELDPQTLERRADVPATIVLPAATDPDETPLPDDDPPGPVAAALDDATDPGATMLIDASTHHGSTVALPIGLGAGLPSVVAAAPQPAAVTPPPRRRRRALAIGLVLLVALLLGGAGWWYVAAGPGAYTTVPPIAGKSTDAATGALEALGLHPDVSSEFSDTVAKGLVVASDPASGDRVRKDGTVEVVVSKGPDYVDVPDGVVGTLQADAEKALEDAGLEVDYAPAVYDDKAGLGVVVAATLPDGSDADAGTRTTRHTVVTLTVSKGPEPLTVRNVVGKSAQDATKQLKADGLKVKTTEAFSDDVDQGLVISQDPRAKSDGHRGDTVTLVVSKGPELVEVPDLFGMQFEKAAKELEKRGLVAAREDFLGGVFGTVRDQSVRAGESVPKGTVVTLTVV